MRIFSSIRIAVALAMFVAAPMAALACSAAGPNIHVGKVLSVDEGNHTFTLLDAETMSPLTFSADTALLARVAEASGNIVVAYELVGDTLRALELR